MGTEDALGAASPLSFCQSVLHAMDGRRQAFRAVGYEGHAAQANDFGSCPVGGGKYLEV